MRLFLSGLFVIGVTVVVSQVASAQQPRQGNRAQGGRPQGGGQRPVNPIVAALDLDKDGTISKEELAKAVESLMKLDKNGDGVLSADEIRPTGGFGGGAGFGNFNPEQFVTRTLEANDKNGDGKLSKEEASERLKGRFDTLDENKDGFLDKDELKKSFGGGARPGGAGGRTGGRPGGGGASGARPARPEAETK